MNNVIITGSSGEEIIFSKHHHLLMIHTTDISMQFEMFHLRYSIDITGTENILALRLYNLKDPEFHMTWHIMAKDSERLDVWLKKGAIPDDDNYKDWKNAR